MKSDELLAWIDIETTGLDVRNDDLLEVALLVTDQQDNVLHEENWIMFHAYDEMGYNYHPVVDEMHTKSGLWDDCAGSDISSISIGNNRSFEKLFKKTLWKILAENPKYKRFVMAGSGVARFDYTWFQFRYPSIIEEYFNYYTLDVGVIRRALELVGILPKADEDNKVCNKNGCSERQHSIWCPLRQEALNHRALQDITDHYEEWQEVKFLLRQLKRVDGLHIPQLH